MKHTWLAFVLILLIVSCSMDPNLNTEVQQDWEGSNCWMKNIDDSTLLRKITIPGTHDSCANRDFAGLSSTAAAQDLTLAEQLEAGVRYIDIRPCLENGVLIIRHGVTNLHITMDQVVKTVEDFLAEHPTEVVVFAVLPEYTDENDFTNAYNYLKELESDYFIKGKDISDITLGSCRGKALIVSRFASKTRLMTDVFCSGYTEKGAVYRTTDLKLHWNQILQALETETPGSVVATYSAGYYEGQFGIPNIRIVSSYIDPKLQTYLIENRTTKTYGIVATDHITKNLAHAIYMCNPAFN